MCKLALLCETRQFFVNMKSSLYRIFPQQIYQPLYGILACSSVCRTCKFTCIVKSDGTCHQCCFMRIISTNSIHKICGLQKRYPTVTEKILNFLFMSLSKPHIYMIYLNCVCLSVCVSVCTFITQWFTKVVLIYGVPSTVDFSFEGMSSVATVLYPKIKQTFLNNVICD